MPDTPEEPKTEFEIEAQAERVGIVSEFLDFLAHNKKWWLLPILIILLLFSLIVILGGSGAAPFIYTLF